ncbi:MAG TPA: AAA family ATPase [Gaiellaceae bacterium]
MEARRERKVVTVLFADLVGFTAQAEQLDPEDVEAVLRPYHEKLRQELERHGGTVEKFIGDAVMALFGAPTAHEDDPERAVRAALAIRDWARDEQKVQVRIAVNTGEALINLGARPEAGEGMAAGDVVNTTARLQAAAPVNGVIVGPTTYRATSSVIEFRELESVEAKGKAEPLAVWEALDPRARVGTETVSTETPLVGRRREVDQLVDALDRTRAEASPQLVTIVGVPGIGKSRLVAELKAHVESIPDIVLWRQGRSLPYGEGVTFWALAQMVKAEAGILETDTDPEARGKLDAAVERVVPDARDAGWISRHLGDLVGLSGDDSTAPREEAFTAWRRLFEGMAEQHPLVLVFDDLQWADEGLLDFVDHLVDWASGVPILVLATARPELLEQRAGWGGGKPNATTLSLSPLSDEDTARLISSLLARPVIAADEQAELLTRSGGNPLYAEQYVRMVSERGAQSELPVPESIQGIVAARLDALPPEEKSLLQDAAVIGQEFWGGALAAVSGAGDPVEERLHLLERKQFVRRERRSSVADETQYVFLHILVRDVAYGQIPRVERILRHRRAAEWIESLGRPEDHAEMLAHHYSRALELARAAAEDVTALTPRARAVLGEAGDRAQSLGAHLAAARFYREALELWPEDALAERADLLFRLGLAHFAAGDEEQIVSLEQAHRALLEAGDRSRAAEVDSLLAEAAWMSGDRDRCFEHLELAAGLVRDEPPTAAKARVLSQLARFQMLAGRLDYELGAEALELAESLHLDELRATNLVTVGTARAARANVGDRAGKDDIQRGLDLALDRNLLGIAYRAYNNLANVVDHRDGRLREAFELLLESNRLAKELGNEVWLRFTEGNIVLVLRELGEWDEFMRRADDFLARSESVGPHYLDGPVLGSRALVRLARDDTASAVEDTLDALSRARRAGDESLILPALGTCATVLAEAGRRQEAITFADELLAVDAIWGVVGADAFVWAMEPLGLLERARSRLEAALGGPWTDAALAVFDGDYPRAAEIFDEIGAAPHAATARLKAARVLVDAGRRPEGDAYLQAALSFWRSVGATRYVREGEELLAASA